MKSNSGGGGGGKWRITIQVFFSPERIDRRKVFFRAKETKVHRDQVVQPTREKKGKRSSSDLVLLQKECKFGETALLGGGEKGDHTRAVAKYRLGLLRFSPLWFLTFL